LSANTRELRRCSIRLKEYDYSQSGSYFVTVCTHHWVHMFGEVKGKNMVLNEAGDIVKTEWEKSAAIRNEIELDAFVVMPNHFHGIVFIVK